MEDYAANVRVRMYQRKYPNWKDRSIEIFGTYRPSISVIANWKASWYDTGFPIKTIDPRFALGSTIKSRCKEICIHPWFYQSIRSDKGVYPVFYFGEDQIMYKLAYA